MILILLAGKAESGKDTVYEFIRKNYKNSIYGVVRYAFADTVKNIAIDLGWDGNKDARGRRLLQWLGDGARDYDPLCWIKLLYRDMYDIDALVDIAVITDCRYPNEISYFKERMPSAYSVRIERPGHENRLDEIQRKHSSETALDEYDYDFYIMNTGTLEELEEKVKRMVNMIIKLEGQKND